VTSLLDDGLVDQVTAALAEAGVPAQALILEITETSIMTDPERSNRTLKALGVGLAIDDFGTGYSSLEAFAASSFDALKVDQSFVRDVTINPRHRAIVRTIIGFAKDLGLLLTAEGIETDEQREMLLELGCEFGQGMHFAAPMPAEEFERRL
jgi:EAL domain-containing protein (putative c-di-GMP-specific phosphodiesterase class I)